MIMRIARDHLGEGFAQRGFDSFHDSICIGHHFVCPETYHTKIVAVEPCGAPQIVSCLRYITVLAAVYFNHRPCRQADEIGEVWSQRKLAAEAQAVELFLPQQPPQRPFCLRSLGAQLTGTEYPPPPNNRGTRLFAPSHKGRGNFLTRAFAIARHHSNTAPSLAIKS